MTRRAIIIGAGPAGLTAAYELLETTAILPVVLEQDLQVGGLSKTMLYKGNGIDMGGHRFFSKSEQIMQWWLDKLPLENPEAENAGAVMLERTRKSRILFDGKLFDYPVSLSPATLRKLGLMRTLRIGVSYLRRLCFPIRPVRNLEDFMINRFGDELYRTFFQAYTEKVWGVTCREISAAWGVQRIKDVSVGKAVLNWLGRMLRDRSDLAQKAVSTSMIERFLYPKLGPGQMWEETARRIRERGGEILLGHRVVGIRKEGNRITGIETVGQNGETRFFTGDYYLSSMPVRNLIAAMDSTVPGAVRDAAQGLQYRDFITVGLLVKELNLSPRGFGKDLAADNWLYIQEPGVKLGRLQFYNNWSPWLIRDPGRVWLGLEYFCQKGDALWNMPDQDMLHLAASELEKINIIVPGSLLDGIVIRIEKAYPAYFGTWNRFHEIREFTDHIENLYLIGRNGMHKYNNQDHSMLTAMAAIEIIRTGDTSRESIWAVNTEEEYHEGAGEAVR